jgi:eukaryotic-like serine/threonine-protein kinase
VNVEPSPTSVPGAVILGKYRVERIIGEGGMGFVVEATHLALGHHVAIKILRNERKDKELVARFEREADIASRLKSEHIARVSDAGKTALGEPFLVMELLEGRTLDEEIKARGPLPLLETIDFTMQACRGIGDAHAAGLVHRDIKPANLFVTRRRDGTPVIKVLDFGLTKAPDDAAVTALTSTTTTFGTPQYMSPEQIRSAKFVDARTDQHALGCVLYECLVGKAAYDAETLTALAVQIATRMPEPASSRRPELPAALDAVIFRALAKEPVDRFADLAGFALALVPFGGPNAPEAARAVAEVLRPGSPEAMPGGEMPPSARAEAFSLGSAAEAPGVRGWSEVMPSRPHPSDPLGVPGAPPSGASRVDPTVTDDGPSLVARAKKQAGASPPSSQPPQPFATPTAQPARPKQKSGVLQSPLFIVGACLISILGVWLLVTLLRPRSTDPAVAGTASGDLEDEPPPANAANAPVPIEQASGAPAASSAPAPQPSKSQQPTSKHRRRHRR